MNVLPIVGRELRVASHRANTWWLRCGSAAVALLLGLLIYSSYSASPVQLGRSMFTGLSIFMLVLALLSGIFLTSDAISSERRGGTLGLLFLTPLRPLDVMLGKLASSSLGMAYGLMAIFPLLFLPLLLGGVTGAETARLCLVILVSLFLSLAMGLRVSVKASNSTHAAMTTFALMSMIALLPFLIELVGWLVFRVSLNTHLIMGISPAYSLKYSGNAFSTALTGDIFWRAIGIQILSSVLLIASACRHLGRHWRSLPTHAIAGNSVERVARPQRRRLRLTSYANPYRWLMERQWVASGWLRIFRLVVWLTWLGVTVAILFDSQANFGRLLMTALICVFALHMLLGLELACESTRPLQEHHQSGALEQVLTTPLEPRWIISGAADALSTRYRWMALSVFATNVFVLLVMLVRQETYGFRARDFDLLCAFLIGGGCVSFANFSALKWIGLMRALIDKTPLQAAMRTLIIVHAFPWLMFALVFVMLTGTSPNQATAASFFWVYYLASAAFSIWLGQRARRHLTGYFKHLVTAGR